MSFKINIESKTSSNTYYRKVLYTNDDIQLVVMNLLPNEEIGLEKHDGTQFIRIEEGSGTAIAGNKKYILTDGSAIVIDAGNYHNIIAGKNGLKLYSIYSPPQHDPDTKEKYKTED